jgi:hypothetical protein
MSGGTWGYQQYRIEELAESLTEDRHVLVELVKAAAQSEHIVDWAESGDTIRETRDGRPGAEKKLYDLWLETFGRLYGDA